MSLYEEIEMQEKERIVDSLATENQRLQEPKTPTQEQIEYIGKNMPTWVCEFGGECVPAPEVIELIITEWEKIRGTEPC